MALLRRLSAWWNRDALERAEEETRMTKTSPRKTTRGARTT